MTNNLNRIALISTDAEVIGDIALALASTYHVDVFKNGFELHRAMEGRHPYNAIISDDELTGANGILLHKNLKTHGYAAIPFIMLLNQLDAEQRKLAMRENIAEIFSKPLDTDAIGLRIDYLVENFNTPLSGYAKAETFKLPLIKRIFDITFSGLALLMLSPLFGIIALLIRLESKGPIFYYSLRVGTGYKIFKFYKFRSMITGADAKLKDLSHLNQYNTAKPVLAVAASDGVKELCEYCQQTGSACSSMLYADNKMVCETLFKQRQSSGSGAAFIKIANDPRITKLGHFIRNMSIDELPQLWNVFIGDMSIVGNRPLPLYEAEKITTDKYSLRFMAPAGITGLWQVEKRGRGEMSESERLLLDNKYAKNHSFFNDIKLIMRTIPALFQSENV